jgi:ribose-phosphate pyrophosphokinase
VRKQGRIMIHLIGNKGSQIHNVHYGVYPGGEVRIDRHISAQEGYHSVIARIENSDDILALMLLKDILDRQGYKDLSLHIPYFPYGRQDRVNMDTVGNQSLSAKVMANLINYMNFSEVIVNDSHSDVTSALINNCVNVPRFVGIERFISKIQDQFGDDGDSLALIAPDAGALKSTYEIAKEFGIKTVVFAEKKRDMRTGEITGTIIHDIEKLHKMNIIIADDICDGGRTFIEIAKALRAAIVNRIEPTAMNLFVTHGIFSKGRAVLTEHFDNVEGLFVFDKFKDLT